MQAPASDHRHVIRLRCSVQHRQLQTQLALVLVSAGLGADMGEPMMLLLIMSSFDDMLYCRRTATSV